MASNPSTYQPGTCGRFPANPPGDGKHRNRAQIREHVPGRPCLCGTVWRHGIEVVNQSRECRQHRCGDPRKTQVAACGPRGGNVAEPTKRVEQKRSGQKCERKRDQHWVRGMSKQDGLAFHVVAPSRRRNVRIPRSSAQSPDDRDGRDSSQTKTENPGTMRREPEL